MSKADSLRPTPASGLNRRRLLAGAGAAAAAVASVPALASSASLATPSPELLRYRAARKAYLAANTALSEMYNAAVLERCGGRFASYDAMVSAVVSGAPGARTFFDAWLAGEKPHQRAVEAAHKAAEDELGDAIDALRQRPVRTLRDLAELSEMVRSEHGFEDLTEDKEDDLDKADLKLVFAAIEAMAVKGGANV